MNSFFAGIDGFDLGFENAGFDIGYICEINDYCNKVLDMHWPDVPRDTDINVGRNKVANQPGVEDIVKQHAYQMALQEFASANKLTMQNALLFPTNGATRIIGEVSYDRLAHFVDNRLIPISVVLMNMSVVIDFYLGSNSSWTSTAKVILRQL